MDHIYKALLLMVQKLFVVYKSFSYFNRGIVLHTIKLSSLLYGVMNFNNEYSCVLFKMNKAGP